MERPSWPACERNRQPILEKLLTLLPQGRQRILEIGSGTGQHADWFTAAQPDWHWQSTDQTEYLDGIRAWQQAARRNNFPPPLTLDVRDTSHWKALPNGPWDWVYNANALHIMSWETVQAFFSALPHVLSSSTGLLLYGPFNQEGQFTSPSNKAFDASLRERDPAMGIRDLEAVSELALSQGFTAPVVHPMPSHNVLLEFRAPPS